MAKRRKPQPATVPEWVVTYGDMMSLLLCFFILLAAFSELKKEHEYQRVVDAIKEAFGFNAGTGAVKESELLNASDEIRDDLALSGPRQQLVDESTIQNMVGKQTRVQTIDEGTRFTIGGAITFDSGSDVLRPEFLDELKKLATLIRGRANRITIRGHAYGQDAESGVDYFELSYRRARSVAEYLETNCGVPHSVLSIEARGETDPEAVGVYGAREQAVNRRVEIILTEVMVDETNPDLNFTNR